MQPDPTYPTLKAAFQDSNNDSPSTSGKNSPVAVAKVVAPRSAWELIVATVMAASLIALVIESYLLHDAYHDIRTQVWVKQDKEEEKFQKFVAGPYAQLAGELKANELLFQKQCKEK